MICVRTPPQPHFVTTLPSSSPKMFPSFSLSLSLKLFLLFLLLSFTIETFRSRNKSEEIMAQATEICYITTKRDVALEGTSDAAKAWSSTLKTISEQEGYQRAFWGRAMEKPDLVLLFIDWSSHAAHQKFIDGPAYGPFVDLLLPLTTSIFLHHLLPHPAPYNTNILSTAPVIEFCTFFNTSGPFLANTQKFVEGMGTPSGCLGKGFGETVEGNVGKYKDGGDGEGKATVLLIGWESKEKHMEFRDTKWFGENVGLLREGCEGGAEMFHVPFKAYIE